MANVILRCFFCKRRMALMLEEKPAKVTCTSCGKEDLIIWGNTVPDAIITTQIYTTVGTRKVGTVHANTYPRA